MLSIVFEFYNGKIIAQRKEAQSMKSYKINKGQLLLLLGINLSSICIVSAAAADHTIEIYDDNWTDHKVKNHVSNNTIFGGKKTEANGWSVTIGKENKVFDKQYSGKYYDIYGGDSSSTEVADNEVVIQVNANVNLVDGGYSSSKFMVHNNTVLINGGMVSQTVCGGYSKKGNVNDNYVTINGDSTIGINVYGGDSENANATENSVTINGGTINGYVYGGYSNNGGDVKDNIVNYAGGSIGGYIYGGKTTGISTGNTLNIRGKDLSAKNIDCFQNLNFYIPADAVSGATLLTLTSTTSDTDLKNMQVQAGVMGGSNLQTGDSVTLLHKSGKGIIEDDGTTYGSLTEGVSLDYKVAISLQNEAKDLVGQITAGSMKPDTKSIVETQALGSALISSGQDQLAEGGIKNAMQAADQVGVSGYTPFAVMGGESMRYHTGSYIDSKGWNIGLGLSRVVNNAEGRLTFGPVISYGHSSYDSYLDDGLHSDGSAHYTGIGFILRQDDKDGFYYEGSFGGGRLKSDYNSSDLATSYDDSANYYAFHAGVGKVQKLSSSASLDYYGKYFYSHQCASSATLATGENYHFDSIDSNRVRIGARVENAYSDRASLYYDAAWEYEFGGDARATYKGYDAPSPSLKGGSGLAEVGWKVRPYKDSPFSADLYLTGWAGKKEGFSLGAMLDWEI